MKFNLHYGQVRTGYGQQYEVERSKKKAIGMWNENIIDPRTGKKGITVYYSVDSDGVVEIKHPGHMIAMSKLGWPIDDGTDGKGNRKLIWRDETQLLDEYAIRIYEELKLLESVEAQGKEPNV